MRRYTTPTLSLRVRGADLTDCDVWVSIEQGQLSIDRRCECTLDGDDTAIELELTQEQTGALRKGSARVQVNWIDEQGHRNATTIKEVDVLSNLLDRVVDYGDD
jgi:hypothetical protein